MRYHGLTTLIVLTANSAAPADDTPLDQVDVERVTVETLDEYLAKERHLAGELLKAAKRGRISKRAKGGKMLTKTSRGYRYSFLTRGFRQRTIDLLEKRAADAPWFPVIKAKTWRAGDVGRLMETDKTNGFAPRISYEVMQVIDSQNVLVRQSIEASANNYLWIVGKTEGLVDGRKFSSLAGVWQVIGTKQYRAIVGTNTVWQLKRVEFK